MESLSIVRRYEECRRRSRADWEVDDSPPQRNVNKAYQLWAFPRLADIYRVTFTFIYVPLKIKMH